jgi:hypothetical protein
VVLGLLWYGHPNGSPWRQFHCTSCEGYFPETHDTIFHGKQVPVTLLVRVLACLAEGLGIQEITQKGKVLYACTDYV